MLKVTPQTPKKAISKKATTEVEKALAGAFLNLRSVDEVQRFLRDVCTPKEIRDLSERWLVARLLDEGQQSYRDIHHTTGVSLTTIGRVARFLQQEPHKGYRLVIDRMKRR